MSDSFAPGSTAFHDMGPNQLLESVTFTGAGPHLSGGGSTIYFGDNIAPSADATYNLGDSTHRLTALWATQFQAGATRWQAYSALSAGSSSGNFEFTAQTARTNGDVFWFKNGATKAFWFDWDNHLYFDEANSGNPTTSDLDSLDSMSIYMKNDKFVIAYNNGGTITYITIPMDGSTTTWTHSTTAP